MLRTLLALAGLLLLAPATASAAPFGELPFLPLKGLATCLDATGAGGELAYRTEDSVQLLTAGPAGLTPGASLPIDGAAYCAGVGGWPGNGGLVAFPAVSRVDREVWGRGFVREPGQGWGEATDMLPPRTHLVSPAMTSAVSERGDGLVAIGVIDRKGAEVEVTRRLPGGAFGTPERFALGPAGPFDSPVLHAGFSAAGEAVVTWSARGPKDGDTPVLWAVVAPPGAPFSAPRRIAPIDDDTPYALAVGADGRALAVFSSGKRLVVAERAPGAGFGAPVTLARTVDALGSSPVAVLRPGGGAVVAWTSALTAALTARTREQAGPFGAPIALVAPQRLDSTAIMAQQRFGVQPPLVETSPAALRAATTADGRVLLAWGQLTRRQGVWGVAPATARLDFAGGGRETSTLGGAVRNVAAVTPLVLADGSSGVAWIDSTEPGSLARVHLAREGAPTLPAAPAPDVKVTLIGSGSLKTRDPLRLRVTCDAACDVYAQLAGHEEISASLSLAAAGSRQLALNPIDAPLAPRRPGKVRVVLRSGAPGAVRATARTLAVSLRRTPIAFPSRALGVTVTPDGDDLVVRWHTATPADPHRYSVWAVDDQDEPIDSVDPAGGPPRTTFAVRIPEARGTTRVIVYELAKATDDTRETSVRVSW